ncbi:thiamine pyrophosphate-binding protein [Shigella flexneri]
MNGAQWVVHALRAQGVNTVFGYPGGALCRFTMHCMTAA